MAHVNMGTEGERIKPYVGYSGVRCSSVDFLQPHSLQANAEGRGYNRNEIPSVRGLFGVGLVLIGAYWLNHNSDAGWLAPFKSLALTPGVALVLMAGLLWAITPLFEKTAIQHTNPESPRFAAFVATTLLTFILTPTVITRGKSAINKLSLHRRDLVFAGLIAGIAPVLGYTALSLGFVGYVTTLFKLSTLMTVMWSFLFLKERGVTQRLPGSLVMVIGAILIAA
jgi:uncharacterized membrane protein